MPAHRLRPCHRQPTAFAQLVAEIRAVAVPAVGAHLRRQGGQFLGQEIPHVGTQIGARGGFGHHRKAETITGRGRFGETEQRFIRRQPPQAAARQHVSPQP